ncbi:MAG: ribbon-helix-helix protein, CopG family [Rhodocyclaceae bacterium]|nr:MAG: ribbon-helix-helix protein, CopG family [Rhodocyclaceae bacterium]
MAVRLDESVLKAIDRKRMELAEQTGQIPTRSDVVRVALETYLKSSGEPSKKREAK